MMDGGPEAVSRRNLFRGRFRAPQPGWQPVEGIEGGPGDVFWAGWADAQGVFVAGDDGVVMHFDGQGWTREDTPAPVPVHAIWGTGRDDLWAVGWMGLILHRGADGWRHVHGCRVDAQGRYPADAENTPLFDITGMPDGRAWAVGDRGTILHFDGADWRPETSGTRAHLRCVTICPDGRVLAAGGDGTILLRAEDGTWQKQPCPVATNFTAAQPLDDGSVLLAGGRYFAQANGFRGDLVLMDDAGCRKLFDGAGFSRFRDIARYRDAIVTVGDGGQVHMIRGSRIDRVASGTGHDLLGLIGLPSGETVAVGDFGTVLVADGTALSGFAPAVAGAEDAPSWEAMDSGTDRQLWGLWHDGRELYACGEEGTVLCLDRGRWERLAPAGALGLHALARAPDGGLFAAGQLGEIHHFDGQRWRKEFDLHMDVTILSLWSDGAGRYFAAGDEGLILTRTPQGWERMASGTRSALYGLWGKDAEHVLAVGDFGLVLRWNGTRWDEFSAGTEHFLFDVWGRALDDIHVVGLSGTLGHFDGQRWRITPARARNDLLAITGDAGQVVAVGAGGAAMRHDGRRWEADVTGTTAGLRAVASDAAGRFYAAGDGGTILVRQT